MLEDIKVVWLEFISAITRFWSNKFIIAPNDEVNYLRMELDKSRNECTRLLNVILEMANPVKEREVEDTTEYQPINTSKYIPWHIKQRQLEVASRSKAVELAREASTATARSKSTEELERELGIDSVGN